MKKLERTSLTLTVEIPILLFLWRWKVATTSAIHLRFEPDFKWTKNTSYSRMLTLKRKGFVDFKYSDNCLFKTWTLTQRGFKAISNKLPQLREEGYLSENIEHDIYVLAAHNGNWIARHSAIDVKNITEQELRRYAIESLPNYLPSVLEHKPDGYWVFGKDNSRRIISLEVEINRKSGDDYSIVGDFYNTNPQITFVLWIVQSQSLANKIVTAASQKLGLYRDIHNFILLSDFAELGWDAVIFHGKCARLKMHEFLNIHRPKQLLNKSQTSLKHVYVQTILDSRVTRYKSSTYENQPKDHFGN
ncbi:MAG: hypothetical protein A4S09_03315 [Proteobacteria bacterium SG_bin7]|nr:MAG: hypothetical protein A4S09_03315 [Proteobacteria bacterium SG_bin7]